MLKNYIFTLLLVGWMVSITFLSLISFVFLELDDGLHIPHMDKLVHAVFYAVAFVLGVFAFRERFGDKIEFQASLIAVGVFVIFYGMMIELFQEYLTTYRSGDWKDMVANMIGVAFGAIFIKILTAGKKGLKWLD